MERTVIRRNSDQFGPKTGSGAPSGGFTLLEMLIALVILSVSILALTSVTLTAIRVNNENEVRNAAIRTTSERASTLLAVPIDSVASGSANTTLRLRGGDYPCVESWTVTSLTNDLRQIVINVQYTLKGESYTNTSVIYKHRAR